MEKAVENHKKGCNCVQAVACVFADQLGYSEDELFRLPETNKKVSYDFAAELMECFASDIGTIMCADIKSANKRSCDECIETAVKILEEYIGE